MKVQIAYRSCIEVDGAQRPVGEALCQMLRGISEWPHGPMHIYIHVQLAHVYSAGDHPMHASARFTLTMHIFDKSPSGLPLAEEKEIAPHTRTRCTKLGQSNISCMN